MSQLQSVVSMSVQTVNTIAPSFHGFIKLSSVNTFRGRIVCFGALWNGLDMVLSDSKIGAYMQSSYMV